MTTRSIACQSQVRKRLLGSLLVALLLSTFGAGVSAQDDIKIYEYSPYRVGVLCTFDSSVTVSRVARQHFRSQLVDELDRTFRAAWHVEALSMPQAIEPLATRDLDGMSVEDLRQNDFVLVVSTLDDVTKTVRTFESAMEALDSIAIDPSDLDSLAATARANPSDTAAAELLDRCTAGVANRDALTTGATNAILVRRSVLELGTGVRSVNLPLIWQTDTLLRTQDKLFFLVVGMSGDEFTFRTRELDCPMRYMGPITHGRTADWPQAARTASVLIVQAFSPVARVEKATSTTGALLLKAGGLITGKDNPARMHVGDVLHPILRRNGRSGEPTLLAPQPWTFAAVTGVDDENIQTNVYSYSGGFGLEGRRNRRTQRVLLRVRPMNARTEIEVVVAQSGAPQPGCFVYERDLITDQYSLLGRTDWRGRIAIDVPEEFGSFLPEEVRRAKNAAIRKSDAAAIAAGKKAEAARANEEEVEGPTEDAGRSTAEAEALADALDTEDDEIQLRASLKQIYVKSGNSVLAKLSFVPGMKEVEVAELRDDNRRLEIEAFVRGFQGQVIDLIGLRSLLAAQIKLYLKQEDTAKADVALKKLQELKNYSEMANQLVDIQRRFMDEASGPIPRSSRRQVDRMFASTRELLQKYLQDDLVKQSERELAAAKTR